MPLLKDDVSPLQQLRSTLTNVNLPYLEYICLSLLNAYYQPIILKAMGFGNLSALQLLVTNLPINKGPIDKINYQYLNV